MGKFGACHYQVRYNGGWNVEQCLCLSLEYLVVFFGSRGMFNRGSSPIQRLWMLRLSWNIHKAWSRVQSCLLISCNLLMCVWSLYQKNFFIYDLRHSWVPIIGGPKNLNLVGHLFTINYKTSSEVKYYLNLVYSFT